jgi:hypothetical protein
VDYQDRRDTMREPQIIDIYEDTPSDTSPYLLITRKVAEVDVAGMSLTQIKELVKIQAMLGRRIKGRYDPPNLS